MFPPFLFPFTDLTEKYFSTFALSLALEATRQIAFADRIILNKTDLVEVPYLDELISRIHSLNPSAPVFAATYSMVFNCFLVGGRELHDMRAV